MSSHEYHSLPTEQEEIIDFPPETNDDAVAIPTAGELDIIRRRELAMQAVEAIEDVLETRVSIPNLLAVAETENPSPARLQARRALRCIKDIGEEDSVVVRTIGEANVYHYAEAVLGYGCSKQTYLGLVETFGISAEAATGFYSLRELIADETGGKRIGFPTLQHALSKIGMTVQQAAEDPDGALAAFSNAGFFVNYDGSRTYDSPIFSPDRPTNETVLGYHVDNRRYEETVETFAWVRNFVENSSDYVKESARE